jgi:type IV secretion system protein VirB9
MAALLAASALASSALASPAAQAAPPPALSYADTTKSAPSKPEAKAPPPKPERPRHHRRERPVEPAGHSLLHDAEVRSTEVPRAPEFMNAALHYTYEPGKLYTVQTALGFLTAIALRPGEHLVSKAAGDTVRWEVGETAQGSPAGPQILLLVKPLDAKIRTNMILTTDQRTYVLDLVSTEGSDHVTLVDWRYPSDDLRELQVQRAALTVQALAAQSALGAPGAPASPFITPPGAQATPIGAPRLAGPPGLIRPAPTADITPAALNFNYAILPHAKPAPAFTPEHVFDDGRKTYVKFPANISTVEIPPLFVIGARGEAELVNYRFENGYYVVDRLFSAAELRLGTKDQQVVRLLYKGGAR